MHASEDISNTTENNKKRSIEDLQFFDRMK